MMDYDMNNRSTCCNNVSEKSDNITDFSDFPVGMCYVPWQKFGQVYDPKRALMVGTIFPELDKPFTGKCRGGRQR